LIVVGISGKDLNPLLLGELWGRNPPQTAVGPDVVVVFAPFSNAISGIPPIRRIEISQNCVIIVKFMIDW